MQQEEFNGKVFYGGSVITMNENQPIIEAVGIEGEKIIVIGALEEVKEKMSNKYDLINLKDNCLLPGFIESHMHLIALMSFLINVDLSSVQNLKELQITLNDAATEKSYEELIFGFNIKEEQSFEKSDRNI